MGYGDIIMGWLCMSHPCKVWHYPLHFVYMTHLRAQLLCVHEAADSPSPDSWPLLFVLCFTSLDSRADSNFPSHMRCFVVVGRSTYESSIQFSIAWLLTLWSKKQPCRYSIRRRARNLTNRWWECSDMISKRTMFQERKCACSKR